MDTLCSERKMSCQYSNTQLRKSIEQRIKALSMIGNLVIIKDCSEGGRPAEK